MNQDLRSFIQAFEQEFPEELIRVSEPVDLEFDIMALVLEYERRGQSPILFFDNIKGHQVPIICNLVAGRRSLAKALETPEHRLAEEFSGRLKEYIDPALVEDPPFRQVVLTGEDADLARLPIPTYFPGDAGPYLTAGMLVAQHPDTGVVTEGYHRFQVKGPRKMGCSLHSRRRMFEYLRLYEERGENMPAAVCLGLHPVVAMGSLSYPPPEISKFQAVGGLFGEPMEIAKCATLDLHVPAWSEIVIEGEFLAGARETEGPFGEFTGYFSARSTENVFQVNAISMREDAWFQSIASGMAGDHLTTVGCLREMEVRNALRKSIPGVKDVQIPNSGCAAFTAFISMRQTRPGEAKHAISIALGVDHYLKFVVIVDDDVDVFNDSDVIWAMTTRVQADRDLVIIPGALGAILDPSASEQGVTAKLGVDATKPTDDPFAERLRMDAEKMAWARDLAERLRSPRLQGVPKAV
ncbi:MAG: UbiD family decarboxylase [Nitrospinota bacterium]|jgi:UbiD family decarboxylase|nr:UbiD family decarboxylase [Nitrospinota bacterium]